jgi:crossover junction endodeoxyribonuclease RusA
MTLTPTMEATHPVAAAPKRGRGRPRLGSATFELPIPPSANGLWFSASGRGRVKTDAYRAWLEEAGWTLKEQHVKALPGAIGLAVLAGLPKRPRDLDNLLKATCDLLQANGIIESDALVCELHAKWDRTIPIGRVRVEVRQVAPPEKRMSAATRLQVSRRVRGWRQRQGEVLEGASAVGSGARAD